VIRKELTRTISQSSRIHVAPQDKTLRLYFMIGLPLKRTMTWWRFPTFSQMQGHSGKTTSTTRITSASRLSYPKPYAFRVAPHGAGQCARRAHSHAERSLQPNGIKVGGESRPGARSSDIGEGDANMAPVLAGVKHLSLAAWTSALHKPGLIAHSCIRTGIRTAVCHGT